MEFPAGVKKSLRLSFRQKRITLQQGGCMKSLGWASVALLVCQTTGRAVGALNMTTDSFFAPVLNGEFMTDPRVRYDRQTQRWFVTAISQSAVANQVLLNNRIMIAVSSGPLISGASSFTFFFIQQNLAPPAGDDNLFADYPTLGIDVNALYMGANMFDVGGNFVSSSGWVIQKSSLLGA